MSANTPTFISQETSERSDQTSVSTNSRAQRTSGRTFFPPQISILPDEKDAISRSQSHNVRGDKNVRANTSSKKSNPHRKYNQYQNQQRSYSNSSRKYDDQLDIVDLIPDSNLNSVTESNVTLDSLSLYDDDLLLYGALNRRGKISLNHLLNFSFPARQQLSTSPPTRYQKTSNYQPYNKERFVNANFRFLVNSMGDYTVYQVDPDLLLDWRDIEQVVITSPTLPSCPICLQKPTAARITKCGHTYCLACILHYLPLEDDLTTTRKWRKCPICWDAVYAKDLKNVKFWTVKNLFKLGDGGLPLDNEIITMRLIQRSANSTMALPRSSTWPLFGEDLSNPSPPWHFTPDALSFSKLILASNSYLQSEYNRDLKELESSLQEAHSCNYCDEIPFIEIAIAKVKEALEIVQKRATVEALEAEKRAQEIIKITANEGQEIIISSSSLDKPINGSQNKTSDSPDSFGPDCTSPHMSMDQPYIATQVFTETELLNPENAQISQSVNSGNSLRNGMYYFYQADDGQRIYLHPLDIRILKYEFGPYENFPDEISMPIIGVEESTMTEDLRKRCKYLSHLPLSCDVTFLEVDLESIVSQATLENFANELQQRKSRRKEKALKEKREHEQAALKEQEERSLDPLYQSFPYSYEVSSSQNDSSTASSLDATSTYTGPRTVWGTPAVSFASTSRDQLDEKTEKAGNEWDFKEEEIYIGKKQKKKKLILMSTSGRRMR